MFGKKKLSRLFSSLLYYFIAVVLLLAGVSKIIEPLPLTDLLFAVELSPILVKSPKKQRFLHCWQKRLIFYENI